VNIFLLEGDYCQNYDVSQQYAKLLGGEHSLTGKPVLFLGTVHVIFFNVVNKQYRCIVLNLIYRSKFLDD